MTPAGKTRLASDEGSRSFVYDDKTGNPVHQLPSGGIPSVGIGRNLADKGLSLAEIDLLFANDIADAEALLMRNFNWFTSCNPVWQDVMVMVEFNTGNVFAFKEMLAYMKAGDTANAAAQLLNSVAAKQSPARYERMADAIEARTWDAATA